jgi:hypothetical protein
MDGYLGPRGPRPVYAHFLQRGGEVILDRRLELHTTYSLEASLLTAPVISVLGRFTAKSAIVNTQGFILRGGAFEAYVSQRLGRLVLRTNGAPRTVSELSFYAPAILHFRGSSTNPWSPGAYLVVKGWQGLTNGAGENQLRMGHSAAGLTRDQLRRIVFENPANLPLGDYSARMLPTGEVVANTPIRIHVSRANEGMVLAWREPYYLQTTTNLADSAQWLTVTQASPWTIKFSDPERYFRLRRY